MAKMTLLEMVQDILNDLEEDPADGIDDTVAAAQVAQIIKTTYKAIIDGRDWPHLYTLFQMDASGLSNRPTHMRIPETVINVEWIKYNKKLVTDTQDKYEGVTYKTPLEFLDILDARVSDASNVDVITDTSGVSLNIYTDKAPTYFTSFDDDYVVFDSYDSDIEATLQNTKTQCWGKRDPVFTLSDSFTPDLPVQMFSYLLSEAKSTCFLILKQSPNQKAEQTSITQRRRMSQDAWKLKKGISYPNYGRRK